MNNVDPTIKNLTMGLLEAIIDSIEQDKINSFEYEFYKSSVLCGLKYLEDIQNCKHVHLISYKGNLEDENQR